MLLALVYTILVRGCKRSFEAFAVNGVELLTRASQISSRRLIDSCVRTPKNASFSSLPSKEQSAHYSKDNC